ncbi:MAG: basic amino acid ABC transporter substrate-binding protein [Clostridia bacterium]|jgi:polar amino acid transport system substrate-binding protein|nr:basic amino acid ABC transporter substrate-binding protein [Clostridia bacterium]
MFKKAIVLVILCTFVLSMGLAGCGSKPAAQDPAAPAEAPKKLLVGSDTAFAPFEYQDEKTQEYVGFDMDLIRAVGEEMGYEVEIQGMPFDGLIPALESGTIDALISAMTIRDDRAERVTFSQPYYLSGLTIVVHPDNNTIKGFDDLVGKNIAVQIGTTGSEMAKGVKDAKVREFNTAPEAFMELRAGGVDAVINDKPVNDYYLAQTGGKDGKSVGEPLSTEEYGIATSKKTPELSKAIDDALTALKNNGKYDEIYEKWFGK